MERERNAIEERLNSTKHLDELDDDESRLKKLNEEDQAIIDDVYASEFDKEAARERMSARNEEISQLQAQISERESAMSLRERIKQTFKKYGVTAIFLAMTRALKKLAKDLGNGLKMLGAKAASAGASAAASLPPGLIRSIVGFIFKAAGSVIGFLAKHTWLLILAVVAFRFE